jgi:hypothetical protein
LSQSTTVPCFERLILIRADKKRRPHPAMSM